MSKDMSKKMMNLTLHVQKESEVKLVEDKTGFELERSPQGVFVPKGQEGLEKAAEEVIDRIGSEGYKHVLVGGSTGLVAKVVKHIVENNWDVSIYEFENSKQRDDRTGKLLFHPVDIRQVI